MKRRIGRAGPRHIIPLGWLALCFSVWAGTAPAAYADPSQAHLPLVLAAADASKPGQKSRPRTPSEIRQQRIKDLTEENAALKAKVAELSLTKGKLGLTVPELEARVQELTNELMTIRQTSANALQVQNERDHLHRSVIQLERELDTLKRENRSLDAGSRQNWFLIGAGVLLGGVLLGWILPLLGWRRRSNWDSF